MDSSVVENPAYGNNRQVVMEISQVIRPNIIVDIGTYKGDSATALASYKPASVYTIDIEDQGISFGKYPNIKFINKDSIKVAGSWDRSKLIDILHIDGNHDYEYLKNEMLAWSINLNSPHLILMHDVLNISVAGIGPFRVWKDARYLYSGILNTRHGMGYLTDNPGVDRFLRTRFNIVPTIDAMHAWINVILDNVKAEEVTR